MRAAQAGTAAGGRVVRDLVAGAEDRTGMAQAAVAVRQDTRGSKLPVSGTGQTGRARRPMLGTRRPRLGLAAGAETGVAQAARAGDGKVEQAWQMEEPRPSVSQERKKERSKTVSWTV